MANKRKLKQYISEAAEAVLTEAFLLKVTGREKNDPQVDELIERTLNWHNEYLKRAGRSEGKNNPLPAKKYYHALQEGASAELREILRAMYELVDKA